MFSPNWELGAGVRTVAEYLAKAAELDNLAAAAPDPSLKKRHADMAEVYRLMAKERKRLIAEGMLVPDPEKNGLH